MKTGIVERVEYTSGGLGNQWTTINGVEYATWWDIRTRDWAIGDEVTFTEYQAQTWWNQPTVLAAKDIKKVVKEPS